MLPPKVCHFTCKPQSPQCPNLLRTIRAIRPCSKARICVHPGQAASLHGLQPGFMHSGPTRPSLKRTHDAKYRQKMPRTPKQSLLSLARSSNQERSLHPRWGKKKKQPRPCTGLSPPDTDGHSMSISPIQASGGAQIGSAPACRQQRAASWCRVRCSRLPCRRAWCNMRGTCAAA